MGKKKNWKLSLTVSSKEGLEPVWAEVTFHCPTKTKKELSEAKDILKERLVEAMLMQMPGELVDLIEVSNFIIEEDK